MSYAVEQKGAIWRLLRKDDGDMTEEVVTSFQGILEKPGEKVPSEKH